MEGDGFRTPLLMTNFYGCKRAAAKCGSRSHPFGWRVPTFTRVQTDLFSRVHYVVRSRGPYTSMRSPTGHSFYIDPFCRSILTRITRCSLLGNGAEAMKEACSFAPPIHRGTCRHQMRSCLLHPITAIDRVLDRLNRESRDNPMNVFRVAGL